MSHSLSLPGGCELSVTRHHDLEGLLDFLVNFPSCRSDAFVEYVRGSPATVGVIEDNLEKLKELGRTPEISLQIDEDHVNALVNFIRPDYSLKITLESLRIIANALVVNSVLLSQWDATEIFDLTLEKFVPRVDQLDPMELYLMRRLGFLFTFRQDKLNTKQVAVFYPLLRGAMAQLPRDIYDFADASRMPILKLSTIEFLKVTFNVYHHYTSLALGPLERIGAMRQTCKALALVDTSRPDNSDIARYLFNCLMCSTDPSSWYNMEGEDEDAPDDVEDLIRNSLLDDRAHTTRDLVSTTTLLVRMLEFAKLATDPRLGKSLLSDTNLSPCLTCLQRVIALIYTPRADPATGAPRPDTRKVAALKYIAERYLLPAEVDRQYPLGSADGPPSLCNRFVQFSADISLATCATLAHDIYWKMCNEQQDVLVSKMGLGFASGFLSTTTTKLFSGGGDKAAEIAASSASNASAATGESVSVTRWESTTSMASVAASVASSAEHAGGDGTDSALTSPSSSTATSRNNSSTNPPPATAASSRSVPDNTLNPVTGQYMSFEEFNRKMDKVKADAADKHAAAVAEHLHGGHHDDDDDWTQEEKEREAERMFDLFDRLNKNGVIKVANPVFQPPPPPPPPPPQNK